LKPIVILLAHKAGEIWTGPAHFAADSVKSDRLLAPFNGKKTVSPEFVVNLVQTALYVLIIVSAPLLITSLLVGLLVSILQAATQINEMTLTFIPKLLTMFLVLVLAGPWMLNTLVDYTVRLFQNIPHAIG